MEIIDTEELAKRLTVPPSWVRDQIRSRAEDKIPHLKFGRYIRYEWLSPELEAWLTRRKRCGDRKAA